MELTTILQEAIPLNQHPYKWIFESESGQMPSTEHLDQIVALNTKGSNFLSKFLDQTKITTFNAASKMYFKDFDQFSYAENQKKEVKKWLFNRKIKFDKLVFVTITASVSFVLTWKMVIHYSEVLFFGYDVIVWDNTLNWCLIHDHNDVFYYGVNRIYDGQEEKLKMDKLIKDMLR